MTASTARSVLATRTLRWSSPLVFNDPFDTPRELAFGVGPADVATALSRRLASLIEHPPDDVSWLTPGVQLIVEMAKRGLPSGVKAEMISAVIDAARMPSSSGGSLDELRAVWRGFLPDFRILCLTEDPASASMWHHYGGAFSGVVLELECLEDFDSPWFQARPVTYTTRAVDMFNADELAEIILMPQPNAREAILDLATFRKSPEWSNEKEWRIVSSKRTSGTGHTTYYPFHAEEVSALFLGPRIDSADRDALLSAARALPRARVVQVEIGTGQALIFRAVTP
jgi:hypothetical protein